ncbi:hypothetical protein [Parapedobacter koreensis]|uniref:Uncharacterized protein n=1 Tax=Parapedobacter koreensis TaxID=332977 RepID=A0A1H7U4H5_9SPHI|nr:hypothetical protein [Parapedobacter koreensis]SEL91665.1 hypothetical protein SAMN05421740_11380 [Parapedobacter koreensis]
MSKLEVLENIGTAAVRRLRDSKLSAGKPFMINSDELPSGQSYLEYPDGKVCIVQVSADSRSFVILDTLAASVADSVRLRHGIG